MSAVLTPAAVSVSQEEEPERLPGKRQRRPNPKYEDAGEEDVPQPQPQQQQGTRRARRGRGEARGLPHAPPETP